VPFKVGCIGHILVEQPEPNTIVVTMAGAAVAGSDCCGSNASIDFNLEQELDIIPTRTGVRPPRIGMVGRVIGTLQVTDNCKCSKSCTSAEQGSTSASTPTRRCGDRRRKCEPDRREGD
jgi:hypothetical protein